MPRFAGFVQFDVLKGRPENNLAAVKKGLGELKPAGPGVVVLPELWTTGFAYGNLRELATATPAMLGEMAILAGKYGVHLAGSLPESIESADGWSVHNTMFIVGPEGAVGSYRKQELFVPMGEDHHFVPGNNPQAIKTGLGTLACLVCYDLRFPELAKSQASQGSTLLLVSAQWPAVRLQHWRTLVQARAIENQMFVVACNRCGITDDIEFGGHSLIVAPDGTILAEAENQPATAWVTLDPDQITAARSRFNTVGRTPYRFNDADKILNLAALTDKVQKYKKLGRRIVFTNGCFDILHQGHVTYLEAARKEGDCLIVGLNSDASVKRLGKGEERPINNEASRARVLAALGCVDHVVLFEEDTPYNLITTLMPDVLVKGGDWPVDAIVGAPEVLLSGGLVKSIPLVADFSTTSVIKKIQTKDA